ncbi:sugar nucleotide-binding protein [Nocardioides sp.]|uniref:sugar nucleotide-binding protein n=1 Tax=Nocardioides sp. TaxID=35761 RepID=UPI003515B9E0
MSDPAPLAVETTAIAGLLVVRLPVHRDARGWFKEAWQREKMVALGLPDLAPVQHNVSFNARRGTTRGLHAEPWDKLVTLATGRAFGAWADLREGAGFGTVVTLELDPGVAVFVPRGVANSYQTLTDDVAYAYLVTAHWNPAVRYLGLALDDPALGIDWPVPPAEAEVSEKDRSNPRLAEITPVPPRVPLVLGAQGQLGRALMRALPHAVGVDRDQLDLTDPAALAAWDWAQHDVVYNAAAWTAVDAAETAEGRRGAWALNARVPAELAAIARRHDLGLVHVSTDSVFDGEQEVHEVDEPVAPLGVYGASKAAGEAAVTSWHRHHLVRTTWLVGEGPNFVRTMADLARRGVSPRVVDDQIGRLTFADTLADALVHLVQHAPPGTYHVTNGGPARSWAAIARAVFAACGREADDVVPVSTAAYAAGLDAPPAPRPRHSTLALTALEATGFTPEPQDEALARYLTALL